MRLVSRRNWVRVLGLFVLTRLPRLAFRSWTRTLALREEAAFWRTLFDRTHPNQRFVSLFHKRLGERRLQPDLEVMLNHLPVGSVARVLDVGSGPVTHVGTLSDRVRVEVTAIDPLADEYRTLREEFGVSLPHAVTTQCGDAETLTSSFAERSFDVVYCRNALDHAHDPLEGIRQMVAVCKRNGCCWMIHSTNEGAKQRYNQLHQWNFQPQDDGDLVVWTRGRSISLRRELFGVATVDARKMGEWHRVVLRPTDSPVSRGCPMTTAALHTDPHH